jgi:hypothetical protein
VCSGGRISARFMNFRSPFQDGESPKISRGGSSGTSLAAWRRGRRSAEGSGEEVLFNLRGTLSPRYEYATAETVELDPLPCWSHLPVEEQRRRVASLVQAIDEEAAARREAAGIRPLGIAAVLAQDPLHRPERIKKSPAPFVHAATKAMRQLLWEGYALFLAAYRSAAERLKAGDPAPPFPAGCFPPALPFVSG